MKRDKSAHKFQTKPQPCFSCSIQRLFKDLPMASKNNFTWSPGQLAMTLALCPSFQSLSHSVLWEQAEQLSGETLGHFGEHLYFCQHKLCQVLFYQQRAFCNGEEFQVGWSFGFSWKPRRDGSSLPPFSK